MAKAATTHRDRTEPQPVDALSDVRKLDPIAILCSDLHLSHKPPLWRSAEPDWYAAQDRPLSQLRNLSSGLRVPVVIAGDIFDDGWRPHRCPPELINFAMRALPAACYAIPGQHDLPYHRYEDRFKSAYWTLVEAKTIVDLHDGKWLSYGDNLILHGFPWNCPIIPNRCKRKSDLEVHLVVAHAYIWIKDHGFPGAKEEHHARSYATALQTYDAAVFGDNAVAQGRAHHVCGFVHGGLRAREAHIHIAIADAVAEVEPRDGFELLLHRFHNV